MILDLLKILIPVLVFSELKALLDYHEIRKEIGVEHALEWFVLAGLTTVVDLVFQLSLLALPLQGCLIWLYFDIRLNQRRGKSLLYIGKTATIDRLLQKLPNAELSALVLKNVLIVLTTLFYLYVSY